MKDELLLLAYARMESILLSDSDKASTAQCQLIKLVLSESFQGLPDAGSEDVQKSRDNVITFAERLKKGIAS